MARCTDGRKAASNIVPLKGRDLCEADPKPAHRASAVASYKRRNAGNPTLPSITIKMQQVGDTTHANISVDHPDALDGYRIIGDAMASGDGTFVAGMVKDLTNLGWKDIEGRQFPDADRANFALSIIKEIGPRSAGNAPASQMAAIHMATMATESLHAASKTLERKELTERSLNKLARTFAAQVEALKRYRSKGQRGSLSNGSTSTKAARPSSATSRRGEGVVPDSADNPMNRAPRCTATSKRTGDKCKAPALRGWKVCRFHGARGGAPRGAAHGQYRHGHFTCEAIERRQAIAELIRWSKSGLAACEPAC